MSHGGHAGQGHGHSHASAALERPLLEAHEDCHGHSHDASHDAGHAGHGSHDDHGHCHGHGDHGHGHGYGETWEEPDDQRRLRRAVYCALFFMFAEIVGGICANSLAIIADAAHMLSDVGGFIVSLVALQLSAAGRTAEYTYGFKQAEVLGALLSIAIVWALTAVLLCQAIPRFQEPEEVDAPVMFIISVIGIFVNIVLMRVLGHGHAHGDHGHAHGGHEEDDSVAVQAALAHVIGDIVQSLGVSLAAVLMWWKPLDLGNTNGVSNWAYADPLCTVLFSAIVLFTTKGTLTRTIGTLMGKSPTKINVVELEEKLRSLAEVDSVHDIHVWSIGSRDAVCTAHVMVTSKDHVTQVLVSSIKVAKAMGIDHSTFQIEIVGEFDPSMETFGSLCENSASSKTVPVASAGHAHGAAGHAHDAAGHAHDVAGHGHDCPCDGHAHDDGHGSHSAHGHSH